MRDLNWSLQVVTPPAAEPVALAALKVQCRADDTEEDDRITALGKAMRTHVEEALISRALITQTLRLSLPCFPVVIDVPRPPLQSVTSITYVDPDGNTQTLDASLYTVDTESEPGKIVPAYGSSWPSTRAVPNAVQVTFVAGYGDAASDVPETIKTAILLLAQDIYEADTDKPSDAVQKAAERLLSTYRVEF